MASEKLKLQSWPNFFRQICLWTNLHMTNSLDPNQTQKLSRPLAEENNADFQIFQDFKYNASIWFNKIKYSIDDSSILIEWVHLSKYIYKRQNTAWVICYRTPSVRALLNQVIYLVHILKSELLCKLNSVLEHITFCGVFMSEKYIKWVGDY